MSGPSGWPPGPTGTGASIDDPAADVPAADAAGGPAGAAGGGEVPPEGATSNEGLVDDEASDAGADARASGAGADLTVEDLLTLVETLTAERDASLEARARLQAEFENYRKRASREQQALVERAHERLVKELLPVLDDLGRALEAAEQHEEATLEDGVRLVHRQLTDVLAKEGLTEIETDGAFDPHVHEALLSQPSDAETGTVLEVLQKGYRLGDRVLRPARVTIAE